MQKPLYGCLFFCDGGREAQFAGSDLQRGILPTGAGCKSTNNEVCENWQECKSEVRVLLHSGNTKSAFSSSETHVFARSDVRVLLQRKK